MVDYLNSTQIESRLVALAAQAPTLCDVQPLPRFSEGATPTRASYLRIRQPGGSEPAIPVLVTGGIHAREWAPPDALVEFAEVFVNRASGVAPNYPGRAVIYPGFAKTARKGTPNDPDRDPDPAAPPIHYPSVVIPRSVVQAILKRVELFIIPYANPEGGDFSRANSANMWWRKNRRTFPGPPCTPDRFGLDQSVGVDINRNFNFAWDPATYYEPTYLKLNQLNSPVSVATDPCSPGGMTYNGTGPESEAETQNVAEFMRDRGIQFYVDVHSASREILYAWGTAFNGNSDATMNFANPAWNQLRTGDPSGGYREYIPSRLERAVSMVAHYMDVAIRLGGTADARAFGDRAYNSNYQVLASAASYPAPGTTADYHTSLQFSVDPNTQVASTTPPDLFSYTLECGSNQEGVFFPHKLLEFPKINREVQLALWGILAYASAPQRQGTSGWPIVTAQP